MTVRTLRWAGISSWCSAEVILVLLCVFGEPTKAASWSRGRSAALVPEPTRLALYYRRVFRKDSGDGATPKGIENTWTTAMVLRKTDNPGCVWAIRIC